MSDRLPWDEHLAWCKKRALKYLDRGDVENAIDSMLSDMGKHPGCGVHPAIGMLGLLHARDNNEREARLWIEGFR